jgi:hypothetical protein
MKNNKLLIVVLFSIAIFQSCFNLGYVDDDSFLGTWELKGREMYSQMTIRIVKENKKLKGYVVSLPNNGYGQTFIRTDEVWITEIDRGANYYFRLTEKKIASELFAAYDMGTDMKFYATFSETKDTIYLSTKSPNRFIEKTNIFYTRIIQ